MSVRVSKWVWEHSKASSGARLVLLCLADHANDDSNEAWPSVATIARLVRLGERQVFKHLHSLIAAGEIIESGAGPRGVKKYRITQCPPELQFTPEPEFTPVVKFTPPLNSSSPLPCREVHPTPELQFTQTLTEPSPEPSGNRHGDFERWWQQVSRKVGKGQARKAYATARRKATADELLAGIMRYTADQTGQDPTYTAHPATWLNGERWKDEPAPARSRGNSLSAALGRLLDDVPPPEDDFNGARSGGQ